MCYRGWHIKHKKKIIWARSCENVSYAICEQQRCRSACASAGWFESYLLKNLRRHFSRDVAHLKSMSIKRIREAILAIAIPRLMVTNFYIAISAFLLWRSLYGPHCNKTNKMACSPSEDFDQPGHPPSLIRVFAVRLKKARILFYPLRA